jgi:predicted nucleotidyltransferase
MNKVEIIAKLRECKQELFKKYGVRKIALFGSYAKDCATHDRDIDLLIESANKDFFVREDIRAFLEARFDTSVDIGYLDNLREFYKRKIQDEIIYA